MKSKELFCYSLAKIDKNKHFRVTKSCIQIVAGKNGAAKPNVCILCGKCIACGICVKACPMEIPEIVEK